MASPLVKFSDSPTPQLSITLMAPYLDICCQDDFRLAVDSQWRNGVAGVVVDCASVEFVDSTGVGLLVALHRRLGGGERRVTLRRVRPVIRNVFKVLCLDQLFDFKD